jgi:Protein of unknown function (DUF4058)
MPSPFPGMNPYLEAPQGWANVHHWLIGELAKSLGLSLPPNYYVVVEERVYEVNDTGSALIGVPDNAIARAASVPRSDMPPAQGNVATLSQPTTVTLPMPIEFKEGYLEVRKAGSHQVITVIEVLSPANKVGEGRLKYEEKRQNVLASRSHLVEIDLLRRGRPMDFTSAAAPTHYRILVSRRQQRPQADLYGFNLQDDIPMFLMPLEAGDVEMEIDLKPFIDTLYDLGRFHLQVDYGAMPPEPKLSEEEREWCDRVIAERGLLGM